MADKKQVRITRHMTLVKVPDWAKNSTSEDVSMIQEDDEVEGAQHLIGYIRRSKWEEMDSPDVLTVTFEPGDMITEE